MSGGEGEGVDITGSKKIKMMHFGAWRDCDVASGLLCSEFRKGVQVEGCGGEEVVLSEALELTVVMMNHLRARIVPRRENNCENASAAIDPGTMYKQNKSSM